MTEEQRDALLLALAQVAVAVLYRLDTLPAAERQEYSEFVANAITAAGGDPYPDTVTR